MNNNIFIENPINKNIFPSEKNIWRCPKCFLIPYIYYNQLENSLEYKCINNHKEKGEIIEIYKKLKSNDFKNKCKNCFNIPKTYCTKCFKFLCNNCAINEKENLGHNVININNLDKVCFVHNEPTTFYCKKEQKSFCDFCNHFCDKNDVNLRNLIIPMCKIEEYKLKIDEMFKKEINFDYFVKIEKILNDFLIKINDLKLFFRKNNIKNNFFRNFYNDLFNSYEFTFKNKILNYNIINNIKINLIKDSNNINNINIENINKILYEIKNKINDLIIKKDLKKNLNEFFIFKTFKEHKNLVNILLKLNNGKIASGSRDSTICIFNSKTFEKEMQIKEHKDAIKNLTQLKNNILISCSLDQTVNFILLNENNSYNIIQKYVGINENDIISKIIELKNGNLISGNFNKNLNEIKIWNFNFNKYEIQKKIKLKEKKYITDIIEIKDNIIVFDQSFVLDIENFIRFWNVEKCEKIKDINLQSINFNTSMNKFLLINKNILIISILNGNFHLININNYQIIQKIQIEYQNNNNCLCKLENNLFLYTNSNYIYQYKYNENNIENVNKIQLINKIKFNNINNGSDIKAITLTKLDNKTIIVISLSNNSILLLS